jgi:hypothetical protein
MNQDPEEKNSRRQFLTFGLGKDAQQNKTETSVESNSNSNSDTIPMLTADGKLVEISKSVLERVKREKATNRDILNWSEPLKNSILP